MKRLRTSAPLRPVLRHAAFAAFFAAAHLARSATYQVDLGDVLVENAVLSSNTGLTKSGLGTLHLANSGNTYTGVTLIEGGSVLVRDTGAFGATSSITIGSSTKEGGGPASLLIGGGYTPQVFDFTPFGGLGLTGGQVQTASRRDAAIVNVGNNTLIGGILASSIATSRLASSFGMAKIVSYSLGTNQKSQFLGSANWQLSGLVGSGNLQKQGAGTLVLSGPNVNTGGIDINSGTVRVYSVGDLGSSAATNAITISGGTLEVRTDSPDFQTKTVTIAGSNTGNLITNTVFLDRAIGGAGLNETVAFSDLQLAANSTFVINSRNSYGVSFTGAGGTISGGGAGPNTFTNNGSGTLTLDANVWDNSNATAQVLTFNGNGSTRMTGSILAPSVGLHRVVKAGLGTLTIEGTASTYRGATELQLGTLAIRGFGALGDPALNTSSIRLSGGTLDFLGAGGTGAGDATTRVVELGAINAPSNVFNIHINANQAGSNPSPVVFQGNLTSTVGVLRILTLGGASTLDNLISGNISDGTTGTTALIKADTGTWVLSGVNTYTGSTTIAGGTLKLQAHGAVSNILTTSSAISFGSDTSTQNAGGTLEFMGLPGGSAVEELGSLSPTVGAGTVKLTRGGADFVELRFVSLGGASSIGASLNVITPSAVDSVRIPGAAGFIRGSIYYNGSNFAYREIGGTLRAPSYITDPGFVTSATALTNGAHQEITGSFATGAANVSSLKISGSRALTLSGLLRVNNGAATSGGILVTGGNATISGGSISQGTGGFGSAAPLVFRVDGPADSLTLDSPITNSTAGGVTLNGQGTLTLGGVNAQTGATQINEGTLRLAGAGRLSAPNQSLSIRQGGTLDLNGVSTGNAISALNGSGVVTNNGGATATLTFGNNNGIGTFTGVLQDGASPLRVVATGGNSAALSGPNTFSGGLVVETGHLLSITRLSDIGQPSGLGRGDSTSDASNAASLVFGSNALTSNLPGIRYQGIESVRTDRLFTLGGTSLPLAGARILSASTANASVVFSNPAPIVYTPAAQSVNQTLSLDGASTADNTMGLRLIDPAAAVLGVSKTSSGTWVLGNDANSYTGTTAVSGGRLVAVEGLSLPAASPVIFAGPFGTGGVLQTSGDFTRGLNPDALAGTGGVTWRGSGGFAASVEKLTVNLGGGTSLVWGTGGFIESPGTVASALTLNSTTALFETEMRNAIDLGATGTRVINVDDNTSTGLDIATLSGVLSGSGATLRKQGAGTLQLVGANTYTGETQFTTGTLVVTSIGSHGVASSSLGGGAVAAPLRVTSSGTLRYVGSGETASRPIIFVPTTPVSITIEASGTGPLVLTDVSNSGTVARTIALRGTNTDGNEIRSVLSDSLAALMNVTKAEGGTWILNAPNTHRGGTTSSFGNLGLGHNTAAGVGSLSINGGSVFAHGGDRTLANALNLQGPITSVIGEHSLTVNGVATFATAATPGDVTFYNDLAPNSQFELTNTLRNASTSAANTIIFDGVGRTVISGEVANGTSGSIAHLRMDGGTLVLSGTSSYTGTTAVTGGKMIVSGSLGQTSSVLVDGADAHLNVTGATNPAAIVTLERGMVSGTGSMGPLVTSAIAEDVTIAPGNSIGIVTVQGTATTPGLDLSEGTGVVLSIELGKVIPSSALIGPGVDYDQIVVAGDTTLLNRIVLGFDVTLELTIPSGLFVDIGDIFYVAVNNANDEPVSGVFASLPEGSTIFASDGTPFTITYEADWAGTQAASAPSGGNDIAVKAVPEPSVAISVILGALPLAGVRKRRARF